MPLNPGTRLGPYEILSPVGAGGMGEVYAARDTRLERRVAIKTLPATLADDVEFQTRFEREAHVISSLAHPHICTLYDVGRDDRLAAGSRGINYLVLEFVEGESLAARLQRGPLPLPLLLATGAQLAAALATAHRCGIVHRDVKPANVILAKSGAKLLDFGIAKPRFTESPLQTTVPTVPGPITSRGSFVGTPNYMAPEQVEGGEADPRSDIFALGALLYEMATGRRAFEGKSLASVSAAILAYEPPPMSSVQPLTPPALERVVRKCLEKDPDLRWQSAADLASELTWLNDQQANSLAPAGTPAGASTRWRTLRRWLPATLGAVLFLLALALAWWRQPPPAAAAAVRAFIPAPADITFAFIGDEAGPPALTRDGRRMVLAGYSGGRRMLFVRELGDTSLRPVAGTEDARFPFWSPDGRSIGFFANGELKRIDAAGGQATIVARAPDGRGGTWGNGFILFTPDIRDPIFRVSDDGGQPVAVTTIDQARHTTHRWPVILPDNEHFLYLAASHREGPDARATGIYLASLTGGSARQLVTTSGSAKYGSGYLLYPRGQRLLAQRFDARRLTLDGEPAALMEVTVDPYTWNTVAAASENGLLAYVSGMPDRSALKWYDRTGKVVSTLAETTGATAVALSPDGTRLAVVADIGPASDTWVYDLRTNQGRRLTFGGTSAGTPVWNRAGDLLVLASRGEPVGSRQHTRIYLKKPDGSGAEEPFYKEDDQSVEATDWSRDGRYLVLKRGDVPAQTIWALPLSGDRKPFPVLKADYDHFNGRLSPDGRWMVYSSREAGTEEIFVTSFPAGEGKWQISSGGGTQPLWRGDGKEIYFLTPDSQIAAAPVSISATTFDAGAPVRLFRAPLAFRSWSFQSFAVTADGQRFILPATEESQAVPLTVQTNWLSMVAK